jgi:hypothetical protein
MRKISLPLITLGAFALWGCSDEPSAGNPNTGPMPDLGDSLGISEYPMPVNSPLRINEIMVSNDSINDDDGEDPSWIELYNSGDEPINLKNYSLTESLDEPKQWVFDSLVLGAGEYMQIWTSGKDIRQNEAPPPPLNLTGSTGYGWADIGSDGNSTIDFHEFPNSHFGQLEDGTLAVSAAMDINPNTTLGWVTSMVLMEFPDADENHPLDLSAYTKVSLQGTITDGQTLGVRFCQTGLNDWEGWQYVMQGSGEEQTWIIDIPPGGNPDKSILYGFRFDAIQNTPLEFTLHSMIFSAPGKRPHTNFKLNRKGGEILLLNPDGNIISNITYPETPVNYSYVFREEQHNWALSDRPSPERENEGHFFTSRTPPPAPALEGGFYQSPISLSLTGPAGAVVRYTTDGTEPNETSPVYSTPLYIDSSMVVRSRAYSNGQIASPITTNTYIIGEEHQVPVVAITLNWEDMFDPIEGMYMEGLHADAEMPHYGANYWADRELPIHIEFFESNGSEEWEAPAGLRIFGNYSRTNPKKSLEVRFREQYGKTSINYPMFPEHPEVEYFKAFVLRGNGNNMGREYIGDMMAQSLMNGLDVAYQKGRSSVVYLNGQYFGIYNIREKIDENYFKANYDVDPNAIDLVKAWDTQAGSRMDFDDLRSTLQYSDLSDPAVYAELGEEMDFSNFASYHLSELYFENFDWPANNHKVWRSNIPRTKWKWAVYDTDFGFGSMDFFTFEETEDYESMFEFAAAPNGANWPNGPQFTIWFRKLLESEEFRSMYINRCALFLSTRFSSQTVLARISHLMSQIEGEIPRDQEQWDLNPDHMDDELESIRQFAVSRPARMRAELRSFFADRPDYPVTLGDDENLSLQTSGPGNIILDGLELKTPVNGTFFAGFPIHLTAVPEDGAEFTGWSDGSTEPSRTILPEDLETLTAEFH